MPARLKDVAALAGVSIKTVSNIVLQRDSKVSPETRERVRKALVELNYQPNKAARHLRNASVGVLGLAIPSLSNPYLAHIGDIVINAAKQRGYNVLIDVTTGQYENELWLINGVQSQMIDGLILLPIELNPDDLNNRTTTFPLLLIGERLLDAPYDHVMIDNVAAARLATNHLISLGRRRIAAIEHQVLRSAQGSQLWQGRQLLFRDLHITISQALQRITQHAEGARMLSKSGYPTMAAEAQQRLQSVVQDALDEMRLNMVGAVNVVAS